MRIYVNQAGYLPGSRKMAIVAKKVEDAGNLRHKAEIKVKIIDQNEKCVIEKPAQCFGLDKNSGDMVWQADFSNLTEKGSYRVEDGEGNSSCHFRIDENIYENISQILCKALYYQRCGIELEESFAGKFKRESCHESTAILLEDYENWSKKGPEAEKIRQFEVSGGWHDAGDYGRYPTAAATALAHILYAYKFFPESFQSTLNIPESGNGMPDILNECLYELRWLMKMQMEDGSVFHKLTSMRHANFVMPCEDKRQMILFPVSTMAVADFAAIMALASRVYATFDAEFSQNALLAAKKAQSWLSNHPEFIGFQNPDTCNTGDYSDSNDLDERLWVAVELYQCTGEKWYIEEAQKLFEKISDTTAMGWTEVAGFAGWALLEDLMKSFGQKEDKKERKSSCKEADSLKEQFREAFLCEAEKIMKIESGCGYFAALESEDYGWGSNMVLLNRAMILGTAYLLEPHKEYLDAIVKQMDYLMGVNATGYSYVTGIGEHSCQNPHNRVTVSDGVEETIPGFVSGGANAEPVDEKAEWLIEPGTPPMKCFLDIWECYSLNEITIYWNSPAIFVAAFLNGCKNEKF